MSAISAAEILRIERFVSAYNQIDDFLQGQMPRPSTFRGAVDFFASRHPRYRDAETLRTFAALRNFLVHEKTRPFDYPCVPSEAATLEIERICADLTRPSLIGAAFGREVVTLSPDAPLQSALELIEKRHLSRFPIYDAQKLVGLLTENGIARFLAQVVSSGATFDPQTPIRNVLPRETKRTNFRFAPPQTPVSGVAGWFHEDTFLEAVLISQTQNAPLLGIVTRGDVAGMG